MIRVTCFLTLLLVTACCRVGVIEAASDFSLHFEPKVLADNSIETRRQVFGVAQSEQVEALISWVLPGLVDDPVRFEGFFLPTFASPPVTEDTGFGSLPSAVLTSLPELRAPVLDLLALADSQQLKRISDMLGRVSATSGSPSEVEIAGLRLLVSLQQGTINSIDKAIADLMELISDIEKQQQKLTHQTLWMEVITAACLIDRFPTHRNAIEFAAMVFERRASHFDVPEMLTLQLHVGSLHSQTQHQTFAATTDRRDQSNIPGSWLITSDYDEKGCGEGRPRPQFNRDRDGVIIHSCAHGDDYLLLRRPLLGRYEVQCDMRSHCAAQILHDGRLIGWGPNLQSVTRVLPRNQRALIAQDQPFDRPKQWVHYRTEVGTDKTRTFLQGRLVHEGPSDAALASWMAMRSRLRFGRFKDVSVHGFNDQNESAIESVSKIEMIQNEDLIDWMPYHQCGVGNPDAPWHCEVDSEGETVLIGKKVAWIAGSSFERLLQYRRPLVEDGEYSLQFFYDPNQSNASIAVGRLAMLITPTHVGEHWITDARYDRTRLRPDNVTLNGDHQLHAGSTGLLAGQWNDLNASVVGDKLTLVLNGAPIFRCQLQASSERKLGLFYYADREQLQVRRAILSAHWPQQDTTIIDELSDPRVEDLNRFADSLPTQFSHDLAMGDDRYVEVGPSSQAVWRVPNGEGIPIAVSSTGKWAQQAISARFGIEGDFDIRARFSNLDMKQASKNKNALLTVDINNSISARFATSIGHDQNQGHELKGQLTRTYPDGSRAYQSGRVIDESTSGVLRIVRRGSDVYCLMAPGYSNRYRLLMVEKDAPSDDVSPGGIKLIAVANGGGQARVTWDQLEIRANRLLYLPPKNADVPSQVGIIDSKTKAVRVLAGPMAPYNHVGSPVWSRDGKWIGYDQSSGSTLDSRLIVMSLEDGKPIDIGFGSLPNFSPDGKQIAFSAARMGVGIQNRDGSGRRIVDRTGWGMQWSPKPNLVAYSRGGELLLYDVATDQTRSVFEGDLRERYSYLYWSMKWSPDGTMIIFKARRREDSKNEIALVRLDKPSQVQVVIEDSTWISNNFSWSQDSRRIMIPIKRAGMPVRDMHVFPIAANADALATRLAGKTDSVVLFRQDDHAEMKGWDLLHTIWSPHESKIVFTGKPIPTPVEWTGK